MSQFTPETPESRAKARQQRRLVRLLIRQAKRATDGHDPDAFTFVLGELVPDEAIADVPTLLASFPAVGDT